MEKKMSMNWVRVKDNLPEKGTQVLVYTRYGFSVCEYTISSRWRGTHGSWVTHWCELPETPCIEEDDNA